MCFYFAGIERQTATPKPGGEAAGWWFFFRLDPPRLQWGRIARVVVLYNLDGGSFFPEFRSGYRKTEPRAGPVPNVTRALQRYML